MLDILENRRDGLFHSSEDHNLFQLKKFKIAAAIIPVLDEELHYLEHALYELYRPYDVPVVTLSSDILL